MDVLYNILPIISLPLTNVYTVLRAAFGEIGKHDYLTPNLCQIP